MRIISGIHRGRRIPLTNHLNIRPTTDKAKEALFSIIENRYFFAGKNMLDLFSGSGSIAFEFASRGVEKVVAVDHNNNCIKFITATSKRIKSDISIIKYDALKYTQTCKETFNFIFADPPYNYDKYKELKDTIVKQKLVKKNGILVIEHDKNTVFNDKHIEVRKYGTVHFSIFSF